MTINKIKKPSFLMFLGSVIYYFIIFFIFILLARCAIRLWHEGNIVLTKKDVTDLLVISGIVGLAAGLRTWLFAWMDDRKAKKSPPSDPK
ncbi:hypothetical protein [[Enterobacter] lignolyticus]|uniref:hypothetical protein n=1 Tax=[Enterobacter] lignolyticus TaxID=1334193 RepID=UPI0005CA9CE1|nr:hypothetical protein [[Enterobacter] lignolyticus]